MKNCSLPAPRANAASFTANGAIYVVGGTDGTKTHGELYWAIPVAGALVGGIGALVYLIFYKLGLSSLTAAALALAATLVATGCMHEDGLADTMDGFGGFHPDDSSAITGTTPAYWVGFRIARAAHAWTSSGASQQGFTLDGYGGLHTYGPTTPAFAETGGSTNHYWNGFDIARDFAFLPNGTGGVLLDGFGGLHPFGVNGAAAPTVAGYSYFGFDVAIKVVIAGDGKGGYTLDAYGGVHPFSLNGNTAPATPIQNTGYWSWRAAIDMALIPGQNGGYTGYVLDRFGGLHPFAPAGGTLPAAVTTSYFGFDIARGVFFLSGSSTDGYTLDGYGGPHPFGIAPKLHQYPYWSGYDIAHTIFGA